ncbi:MAG: YciI family protein [Rhodospirillales bacterium]
MLFAIKILDKPDAAHLRDVLRKEHLDYLAQFDNAMIFDGPFLTDDGSRELGSFRIMDAPNRQAAQDHVDREPFVTGGLQHGERICRFQATVPYTYLDCPRTPGNIQFFVMALDKPNRAHERDSLFDTHMRYHETVAKSCMTYGQLITDEGDRTLGSLLMFDVPDIDTAYRLWANDPLVHSDLFETVVMHRWRFGRTFDRFNKRP